MANGNPFVIDQGAGLAGLSESFIQGRQQEQGYRLREEQAQMRRDQVAQTQKRREGFQAQASAAFASGDPHKVAQLMTDYPEFAEQATKRQKYLSEATKQNAIKTYSDGIFKAFWPENLKKPLKALQKRAATVVDAGGDPSDTLIGPDLIREDPEKAKKLLLAQLAADTGDTRSIFKVGWCWP